MRSPTSWWARSRQNLCRQVDPVETSVTGCAFAEVVAVTVAGGDRPLVLSAVSE